MRIVFDTNVLIAAFITRGASAEVFEHCLFHHSIISSPFIFRELEEKLTGKFQFPKAYTREMLDLLHEIAAVVAPLPLTESVCRDADDDWILAAAAAGNADVIITGDKDLLELKSYATINIIRPADFWRYESSG